MRKNVDLSEAFSYLQARKGAQADAQREHLGPTVRETTGQQAQVRHLAIDQLSADPAQPRRAFPEESLAELAESIRSRGVLQPILVRPEGAGRFRIVAGERRYRAARAAGLREVPCLVREFSEDEALAVALVENVHREDLTDIDKSDALRRLKELSGKGWEEIARMVHLSHVRVRTLASLQTLADPVKEAVRERRLAGRVARVLKPLPPGVQEELLRRAVEEELTAEALQGLVREHLRAERERAPAPRRSAGRSHAAVKHALALITAVEREAENMSEAERDLVRDAAKKVLELLKRPNGQERT